MNLNNQLDFIIFKAAHGWLRSMVRRTISPETEFTHMFPQAHSTSFQMFLNQSILADVRYMTHQNSCCSMCWRNVLINISLTDLATLSNSIQVRLALVCLQQLSEGGETVDFKTASKKKTSENKFYQIGKATFFFKSTHHSTVFEIHDWQISLHEKDKKTEMKLE